MTQIDTYSVGELARLSGVSVRTLHHYHSLGLLVPAVVASNGYRHYGRAELDRLQDILFYKAVGLSLADIGPLLDADSDRLVRLLRHRERLVEDSQRLRETLAALDATIDALKGKRHMPVEDLYKSFPPEQQAGYEAWLIERYGPDMAERIEEARPTDKAGETAMQAEMEVLRAIEFELVTLHEAGTDPSSSDNAEHLEAHRALMARIWKRPCPPEAVEGLADLYLSHPDFIARYERLSPRFSAYLTDAMKAHAGRLREMP
ncbi:MerR family transcriptional regulator [Maricaulis parjimensis]|uniref:MerR family transcriptional regulator n=1 Tax=Maricaulis parjimensis TaxID=144023 RepID=UPI0019393571|nr:MerR family transcriptional regulator [Maricaulis parjimensis]